jgi:uncharacterized protein (TIGR02598 family)
MRALPQRGAGFSLVEVTLALGVAGFCLLTVFALLPMGVQTNRAAFSQTAATTILSDVSADLRVASQSNASSVTSAMYGIVVPASGSTNTIAQTLFFDGQGGFSTTLQTSGITASRYRLAVTFPAPSSNAPYATLADIKISWPAAVDATSLPANAAGLVETVAAFRRP